jgi:hypothetical protein
MKQIDIKELIPFMKDGWVAMDKDGRWFWYIRKPNLLKINGIWKTISTSTCELTIEAFDIAPANDWTKSLICINELQNNLCTTDE